MGFGRVRSRTICGTYTQFYKNQMTLCNLKLISRDTKDFVSHRRESNYRFAEFKPKKNYKTMKNKICSNTKTFSSLSFFFITTMFFPPNSMAESGFLQECNKEQASFCAGIPNKKAKISQCLLENSDKLSNECQTQLKKYADQMRDTGAGACKADVWEHCRWVIPGGGRIIKCLFKHEDKLSDACKKALNE
jgi:hypothetical protein